MRFRGILSGPHGGVAVHPVVPAPLKARGSFVAKIERRACDRDRGTSHIILLYNEILCGTTLFGIFDLDPDYLAVHLAGALFLRHDLSEVILAPRGVSVFGG